MTAIQKPAPRPINLEELPQRACGKLKYSYRLGHESKTALALLGSVAVHLAEVIGQRLNCIMS
jgi:hypothetical protein